MKDIKQWQKRSAGEWIGLYLKSGWTFESIWEKLILCGLCTLGLWKIIGWIW